MIWTFRFVLVAAYTAVLIFAVYTLTMDLGLCDIPLCGILEPPLYRIV